MGSPDQREAAGRRYYQNCIPDKNLVAFRETNKTIPACSQGLEISLVRPRFVVKYFTAILGAGKGIQKSPDGVMVKIMKAPVTYVQRNSLTLPVKKHPVG